MTPRHILVVDDEPDIRNLVRDILQDEGYTVTTAEGGEESERAVIDFKARRRDEPDPDDALEDEMARLLNDLTGDTNRVG